MSAVVLTTLCANDLAFRASRHGPASAVEVRNGVSCRTHWTLRAFYENAHKALSMVLPSVGTRAYGNGCSYNFSSFLERFFSPFALPTALRCASSGNTCTMYDKVFSGSVNSV